MTDKTYQLLSELLPLRELIEPGICDRLTVKFTVAQTKIYNLRNNNVKIFNTKMM